jgi:hypothetical protein
MMSIGNMRSGDWERANEWVGKHALIRLGIGPSLAERLVTLLPHINAGRTATARRRLVRLVDVDAVLERGTQSDVDLLALLRGMGSPDELKTWLAQE